MSNLQNLEVTAGNQVILNCETDGSPIGAVASIIGVNLDTQTALTSVFAATNPGATLSITLPIAVTLAARTKNTVLQIAWDYGNDHIENTRVNVVGVQ